MALTSEQQAALANEARRQELKQRISRLKGFLDAVQAFNTAAASRINETTEQMNLASADLVALDDGAGLGLTADYGAYSTLEQAMRNERFAGKSAAIDYVKANPECTEADIVGAYTVVAMTTRPPDRQTLLQNPSALFAEYLASAIEIGALPAGSGWLEFRSLLYAMPKEVIMGL